MCEITDQVESHELSGAGAAAGASLAASSSRARLLLAAQLSSSPTHVVADEADADADAASCVASSERATASLSAPFESCVPVAAGSSNSLLCFRFDALAPLACCSLDSTNPLGTSGTSTNPGNSSSLASREHKSGDRETLAAAEVTRRGELSEGVSDLQSSVSSNEGWRRTGSGVAVLGE